MPSAQLIRPLYGQCTKKGLGTINKERHGNRMLCPYRNFSQAIKRKYQDSNALSLHFEHVDIKWYHLLPTPLEFECMVDHLVLLVLMSTQMRNQT